MKKDVKLPEIEWLYEKTEKFCYYLEVKVAPFKVWVDYETFRKIRRLDEAEWKKRLYESRCLVPAERGTFKRCQDDCKKCSRPQNGLPLSYEQYCDDSGNEVASDCNIVEEINDDETFDILVSEILKLDELGQKIITLYMEEKTEREIASRVGLSQKGVNLRINKFLRYLEQKYQKI